jgi:8-oxo-dGTP diphosphatase
MLSVVCAIIIRGSKILVTKRPAHKKEGLKWEFPGGKVESGETEQAALTREIKEELSIEVNPIEEIGTVAIEVPHINLTAWNCQWLSGEIHLTEHLAFDWVEVQDLKAINLSGADVLLIPQIKSYIENSSI